VCKGEQKLVFSLRLTENVGVNRLTPAAASTLTRRRAVNGGSLREEDSRQEERREERILELVLLEPRSVSAGSPHALRQARCRSLLALRLASHCRVSTVWIWGGGFEEMERKLKEGSRMEFRCKPDA
jgi:hypothetical protein